MSYVKAWIHIVCDTKNRDPIISKEIRAQICVHIKEYAKTKDIFIYGINGYNDHIHLLIALSAEQSISKVVNLIKGESSHWINENKLTNTKFSWADEYYAGSIGESQLTTVINYINNQSEHHRVKSFKEECEEFLRVYGFRNQG
ncbi:MAG: IS200/IS605 family transposase [bacterium]